MKTTVRLQYGPLTFAAELPARTIKGHDRPVVSGADAHRLEQAAARWIIERGIATPDTLRALRAAAGLTSKELAGLLGVNPSRISEWEKGKYAFAPGLWVTLAHLALEAIDGRDDTVRQLRAMQEAKAPKRTTVELTI